MPRTRNNNQSPVSLFPFLAVLISAMGALIFLLIVITNKVKHDVKTNRQQGLPLPVASMEKTQENAAEKYKPAFIPVLPTPVPQKLEDTFPLGNQTLPLNNAEGLFNPLVEAQENLTRTRPFAEQELEKLRDEYRQWQAYTQQLDNRLEAAKEKVSELDKHVQAHRKKLQTIQKDQDGKLQSTLLLGEQTAKLEKQLAQFKIQVDQMQKTREELEQKKKKVEYQAATRTSEWAIIPFDGISGTTRRPIYIECTAEGVTFQPEGVTLKLADLENFTSRFNPVLSGVMVLREHWLKEDKKNTPNDVRLPYILVIVRPSGTLGFYGTQTLLQKIASPMGYELVEEDRPLVYPPKSREAQELLIEAIKETYGKRANEITRNGETIPYGYGQSLPQNQRDERWTARPAPAPAASPENTPNGKTQIQQLPYTTSKEMNDSSHEGNAQQKQPNRYNLPLPGEPGGEKFGTPEPAMPNNIPTILEILRNQNSSSDNPQEEPAQLFQPDSREKISNLDSMIRSQNQTQGNPPAGMTFGETIDEQNSPDKKLKINGPQQQEGPQINKTKKKIWGAAPNSSLIGMEQSLLVKINNSKIQIGKRYIDVGKGESAKQIQDAVSEMAYREIDSWGDPPEGFRWVPSLKCKISPGGNIHYERFANQLRKEGYSVVAEQVFNR